MSCAFICLCVASFAVHAERPTTLPVAPQADSKVTATWYGVSTLLFDDGATKILIDGFFSRPQISISMADSNDLSQDLAAAGKSLITPDVMAVDNMIARLGLAGLAAIVPAHSHFDHAMDLGVIAKRTGSIVLGSESTANIARGAGVDEGQIRTVDQGDTFEFGAFTITLIKSAHAPMEDGGPPIPGRVDVPLVPPASVMDWKEGGSYSIFVEHPSGSTLVQGSAGYVVGALDGIQADSVFLGIGGLTMLGRDHAQRYWSEIVEATGGRCVFTIHWDDLSKPLGEIVASPGTNEAIAWLRSFAGVREMATLPFATPIDPFKVRCAE